MFQNEIKAQKLNEALLNEFAWGIPEAEVSTEAYGVQEKTFFADRYGGFGIGKNWGSGRAAEAGQFQLKGIGKTSLVALEHGLDHSNGMVPIEEGIREAIWGEVNQSTPHGSNRVIALIERGTVTKLPNGTLQKDVIVVRESSIRPAHFLSAFGDGVKFKDEKQRVQSSAEYFLKALPEPRYKTLGNSLDELYLAGLKEYVDRIAEQYAYLYANRLYHGATSPSNIELTGKMIDYGTQSAQAGYGKLKILKHAESSGEIKEIRVQLVENFIQSLHRDFPSEIKKHLPSVKELSQRFDQTYQNSLKTEFLKLTGVPPAVVGDLALDPLAQKFSKTLIKVGTRGAVEFEGRYSAPLDVQKYELTTILKRLATDPLNQKFVNQVLQEQIPGFKNIILRSEFASQYQDWIKASLNAAGNMGMEKETLLKKIAENAKALNHLQPDLYRWNSMNDNFKMLLKYNQGGDEKLISSLINDRIQKSKTLPVDYHQPIQTQEFAPIHTVEKGVQLGYGISPNEFRQDFFAPHLSEKRGILVSVGSFRTLNKSAMGNFSKTVLLDYDEVVTAFNSVNLDLIGGNQSRRRYLAQLATGRHPSEWKYFYEGKGTDQEFFSAIQKYVQSPHYRFDLHELKKIYPSTTIKKIETLLKNRAWETSILEMFSEKNQWGYASLDRYFKNGTWNQSLFGSDSIYQKIYHHVKSGNFHVMSGNISSGITSTYLKQYSQSVGEKISVLDISNADSHLAKGKQGKHQLSQLSSFINDLPLTSDAIILSTSKDPTVIKGLTGGSLKKDHWRYFIHTPKEYTEGLKSALTQMPTGEEALQTTLNHYGDHPEIFKNFEKVIESKSSFQKPTVMLVTGPMGVGKSTLIESMIQQGILDHNSWSIIDVDQIKLRLPLTSRAANSIAVSDALHAEAAELGRSLTQLALKQNKNVILYASLANMPSVDQTLTMLDRSGKTLRKILVQVNAPLSTVLERNQNRFAQGGHFVNPEKIQYAHESGSQNFNALKKHFETSISINNTHSPVITQIEKSGKSIQNSLPISEFKKIIDGSSLEHPLSESCFGLSIRLLFKVR